MRRRLGVAMILTLCLPARHAFASDATGHEFVSGIAIEKLPDGVPAFVCDPATLPGIALMGREPDRSNSAGETHDRERDPGHYIDLTDDAREEGIVPLDKLPVTREAYDTQLHAGGSTKYKARYLPYATIDAATPRPTACSSGS